MESLVPQLGVAGILIYLLIKEMFSFLKSRNGSSTPPTKLEERIERMDDRIEDLHVWHSQTDEDGVKIWYVRRSLEEAVDKLSLAITSQTTVMQALAAKLNSVQNEVKRLEDKIDFNAKSK